MIEVYRICESICDVINARELNHEVKATAEWKVSKYAEDVTFLTITAVPESFTTLRQTRNSPHAKADAVLSVMVQGPIRDPAEVTGLASLVASIERMFREEVDFKTVDGNWIVSRETPVQTVLVREHLEEVNIFTCGIVVTLAAMIK